MYDVRTRCRPSWNHQWTSQHFALIRSIVARPQTYDFIDKLLDGLLAEGGGGQSIPLLAAVDGDKSWVTKTTDTNRALKVRLATSSSPRPTEGALAEVVGKRLENVNVLVTLSSA